MDEKLERTFDQSYETAYAKICPDPENEVHAIVPPTPPGPHPFNLCFESLSLGISLSGKRSHQKWNDPSDPAVENVPC